jgi:magnesium-transporting ATPase (P-type)
MLVERSEKKTERRQGEMRQEASSEQDQASRDHPPYHAIATDLVLEMLQSHQKGLSQTEVTTRLREHGLNLLPARYGPTIWNHLFEQINSPLIYVLLVGAALSFGFSHLADGIVILGVIFVNITLGLWMEEKAQRTTKALTEMLSHTACVRRDDERMIIEAKTLTRGDIYYLQAGDIVPADGRILTSFSLSVMESALTGEAEPVMKSAEPCADIQTPLAERESMVYSGTKVMKGNAACVVTSIGVACEIGRIQTLLENIQNPKTPLVLELDRLGLKLAILILIVALLALGVAFAREYSAEESFSFAIGVAVAAIPEGLPSCVTITFAIGVRAMALQKAIVKSLPAAETLGSVCVICSDKTGTLTMNEMAVQFVCTEENCFQVFSQIASATLTRIGHPRGVRSAAPLSWTTSALFTARTLDALSLSRSLLQ